MQVSRVENVPIETRVDGTSRGIGAVSSATLEGWEVLAAVRSLVCGATLCLLGIERYRAPGELRCQAIGLRVGYSSFL